MLNTAKHSRPQDADAARSGADAVSRFAGFKHAAAVVFALCAAIALVTGLAFAAGTAPKAEAQTCTIQNPQQFSGKITAAGPTGQWPSHRLDLSFPTGAYVSEVSVTSKVRLGNETNGKWQISIGGQTFTNGSGVTVAYPSGSTGTVTFKFDRPVKVSANSTGAAFVTLFGQSGGSSNYTMTYKGSVNDPCASAPTTPTSASNPTSASPTSTSAQPSTPATSGNTSTTPTSVTQPSTANPAPGVPAGGCSTSDALLKQQQVTVKNGINSDHAPTREISLKAERPMLLDSLTVDLRNTNNAFYYSTVTGDYARFNNITVTVVDSQGTRVFTMPADMNPEGSFRDVSTTKQTQGLTLNFDDLLDVAQDATIKVSFLPASTGGRVEDLNATNVQVSAEGLICSDQEGNPAIPPSSRLEPKDPVKGPPKDPDTIFEASEEGTSEELATIRIHARAFNDGVNREEDSATNSKDLRFTKGAVFELRAGKNRNSTTDGPGSPIRGSDGKPLSCTIDDKGYCDINIRVKNGTQSLEWYGKRVWAVQTKAADGAYWEDTIKTGSYESPQTDTWTIGYTDTLRGGRIFYPSATGNNQTRSFGAAVQALKNPKLPATCNPGPKIAFVMDVSGSVRGQEVATYRNALTGENGVVDQLSGTNASVSAYTFNWDSPSVNTTSIGNYQGTVNVDTEKDKAKAILNDRLGKDDNILGRTNWNSGLEAAYQGGKNVYDPTRPDSRKYDIVVFITDGNPNTTGNNRYRPDDNEVSLRALEGGVYASNKLKSEGTRIIAVAAGKPGQNTPENLKLISGQKENEDYFIGEWNQLATNLSSVVRAVSCQSNVSVTKQIKNADGTITPGAGWEFEASRGDTSIANPDLIKLVNSSNRAADDIKWGQSVKDKTDANGYAIWGVNFNTDDQTARATINLKEFQQEGYEFESAKCTLYGLEDKAKTKPKKTVTFSKENYPEGNVSLSGDNQIGMRQQWDCEYVNAESKKPDVSVVKKVESAKQRTDGKWEVKYGVTVSNLTDVKTVYTLTDELRFGEGITPLEATYGRKGEQAQKWADIKAQQILAKDQALEANGEHEYQVTVVSELEAGATAPKGMTCKASGDKLDAGGFLNVVHLESGGTKKDSWACEEPVLPEITKTATGQVTGPDADGQYTASYTVTVRNRSHINHASGKPLFYTLTDTPQFAAGVDMKSWTVSGVTFQDGGQDSKLPLVPSATSGTEFPIEIIKQAKELQPGANDQFTVSVKFELSEDGVESKVCSGEPGNGLFNGARVSSGKQYRDANACLNVPDQPTFSIGVEKWGIENGEKTNFGNPGPSGSYGFALTNPDGTVTPLTRFVESGRGGYVTNDVKVKAGLTYTLTETKAPQGYALLAEPVKFRLVRDSTTKQYVVQIVSGGSANVSVVPSSEIETKNLGLIQVADVRQGWLPRTGGHGLWWPVATGLMLALYGAFVARRRVIA